MDIETMNKIRIAIDPGKSGAMAIMYPSGDPYAIPFTTESEMRDELETVLQFDSVTEYHAVLEKVHAMPGQGVTSMFTFGANYGFWRGLLQGLRIPFDEVRPQEWQKGLNIKQGLKGAERKRALKQIASERYPRMKVTLKTADALLMLKEM